MALALAAACAAAIQILGASTCIPEEFRAVKGLGALTAVMAVGEECRTLERELTPSFAISSVLVLLCIAYASYRSTITRSIERDA